MSHWETVRNAREFDAVWNALCRFVGAAALDPGMGPISVGEMRDQFKRCAEYHGGMMQSGRLDVCRLHRHHDRRHRALIYAGVIDDAALMHFLELRARKEWSTFSVAAVAGDCNTGWISQFLEDGVRQTLGEILLCLLLARVPWEEAGITAETLRAVRKELREHISRCSG